MPPPSAPLPVRGYFWPWTGKLRLQFRPRLAAGLYDDRGFQMRADRNNWDCDTVFVPPGRGHWLHGLFHRVGIALGGPWVDYSGNDLIGVNGILAPTFNRFPVTVLPGLGPP